ncbi:uncharacterized protein YjbI with pentapeptide repeats [Variovorax sp. TBS-050B]|uniref:DUF2169 family type VI secretion system accessory protein n=1 Tax=Variovorax sp. TBS-050B TaxID=2940551 RepID=UPI002474917A|nr:DUF2169 domain-containing protein [Variovorax sp. TBS-050B]MDH6594322.1 uncharacterized protein YjbI with pentapeptide repeats [Variovorax sp. TBS-050B]
MKTVKPLRLSVITRPFLRSGHQRLALTVMGMVSMDAAPVLLPETEFWKTVSEELGPTGAIDLGMPKPCAEFLATGHAYTRHQDEKTACAVSLRVGALERQFVVFGDRYWIDGRASAPQPFESMRLDWTRAYGGPAFAENPLGIGHQPERVNGLQVQRLPNVEHPNRRIDHPGRVPEPACPGAIDVSWPQRMRLIGSDYGAHWRENLFPGFAEDMDWRLFNAAPPAQRWAEADRIPGGTPYEIWNMHPDQPVQRGQLPDWRARGFIARKVGGGSAEPERFEEVELRLTTAWFFPHRAQIALIFHGETAIAEDDAADVTHVMPAIEHAAEPPRALGHYFEILQRRCDTESGALHAFRDEQLLPAESIGPWIDQIEDEEDESPRLRNMRERARLLREEIAQQGIAAGRKPRHFKERPVPEPFTRMPTLAELPEFIERTKAYEREQMQKLEEGRGELARLGEANAVESRKVGFDTGRMVGDAQRTEVKGPPAFDAKTVMQGMLGIAPATRSPQMPPEQQRELEKAAENGRRGLIDMYRLGAQHQAAADTLDGERAAELREKVRGIMAGTRDLSGMDLTGADLSGLDLRRASMRRTLLESAKLAGARLDGADATEAVLVRADLSQASLAGCTLHRANLSLAHCAHTDFAGAAFEETTIEKTRFAHCSFEGATLAQLNLFGMHFEACRFDGARLDYVTLLEGTRLVGCSFRGATLHKFGLISCEVERLDFSGASLEACAWVHTAGDSGVVFRDAALRTSCFVGSSSLRDADFEGATLHHCSLREMPLEGARFVRATLDTCDLSSCLLVGADLGAIDAPDSLFIRADFTQASLRGANLMNAHLQKSRFVGTDLREANLFRADVSQSTIDTVTETHGAYLEQAKTLPRRLADPVQ